MSGYPSYRVPRADGTWLCEPNGAALIDLAPSNHRLFARGHTSWLGVPLGTLRQSLRAEIPNDAFVFVSGHQPELFHPGVWFKNFLLSKLAAKTSGVAINVLVDHDPARTLALEVPFQVDGRLQRVSVPIASNDVDVPWELALAGEPTVWQAACTIVTHHLRSLNIQNPLMERFVPTIVQGTQLMAGAQCLNPSPPGPLSPKRGEGEKTSLRSGRLARPLGVLLAEARHRIETEYGLRTREIAFSKLTDSMPWAAFVGEILTKLPQFHQAYNTAIADYRFHHRIKNLAQPVPELKREGEWYETPFWMYETDRPNRRPLWMRLEGSAFTLGDRPGGRGRCFSMAGDPDRWRGILNVLAENSTWIRPRALATTMYLRLALADVFIHGIGGAKYDQVTDRIIRTFWKMEPPRYVVATATLHLPISKSSTASRSVQEMTARARDWRFTPERAVQGLQLASVADAIVAEKSRLLATSTDKQNSPARHAELQRLNDQLRALYPDFENWLKHEQRRAVLQEQEAKVRTDREYSFALFPSGYVEERLDDMAEQALRDRPTSTTPL